MRRHNWLIGALTIAATLASFTPSAAQGQIECCSYRVTHQFRLCLPQGCQPQVVWKWQTQASAWQIGFPPVINTNNGAAIYGIPSSDTKCASAVVGQDCAFSTACATFSVNFAQDVTCRGLLVQGQHSTYGRACVRCRRHGSNSQAQSHIVIACLFTRPFNIFWAPQFSDSVGGGCETEMRDPVDVKLRNPQTGETRTARLFELEASGIEWQPTDSDGDGWPDTARIRGRGERPVKGHITLQKRTASGQGGESRIRLEFYNSLVSESESSGEFSWLQLPQPGDPMPGSNDEGIEVPAVFDLQVDIPPGWEAEEITMGGGGESGQPLPVEGDVNGDGCVDDADLLIVLFNFGNTGGQGDVNNDGIVDDADLLIVLFNFGTGC